MSVKHLAKNQIVLTQDGVEYFVSYNTTIAKRDTEGNVTLDRDKWDYSQTTHKWRGKFLGESTAETRAKIDKGIYKLDNLNKG